MFSTFLSIYFSRYDEPNNWFQKVINDGYVKMIKDDDSGSYVVELRGLNVSDSYITWPVNLNDTLNITSPFLVLVIENSYRHFMFEVQVTDSKRKEHWLRFCNFQSVTQVQPALCSMPMQLADGWNLFQVNLPDITRRAYGSHYVAAQRIKIHANCRLRMVFFSNRLLGVHYNNPRVLNNLPVVRWHPGSPSAVWQMKQYALLADAWWSLQ